MPTPPLPPSTRLRIAALPKTSMKVGVAGSMQVVKNFGLLVDVRHDRPEIPTFDPTIPRGMCRLIEVNLVPDKLWLVTPKSQFVALHPKHVFLTHDDWTSFVMDRMITGGGDPRDKNGLMPTILLRDARRSIYLVRSFRQVVMDNYLRATGKKK